MPFVLVAMSHLFLFYLLWEYITLLEILLDFLEVIIANN
jgi:hypothetical protein